MITNKICNKKVWIEKLERKLTEDNRWIDEYVAWKEVWASISLRNITAHKALYLFVINWCPDFPCKFRLKINEKIFVPTQSVVVNFSERTILFHAVLVG